MKIKDIKDYKDIFDQNGGDLIDKMDIYLIMGMFSYIYITQVVISPDHTYSSLLEYIKTLSLEEKILIF